MDPAPFAPVIEGLDGETRRRIETVLCAVAGEEPGIASDDHVARTLLRLGPGDPPASEDVVLEVLDDLVEPHGPLAWLAGDRTVEVASLTEDIVLTHRLTDFELEIGAVHAAFDLAGFLRRDGLHLADGRPIDVSSGSPDDVYWRLGTELLGGHDVGALIAVRVDAEGMIEVEPVDAEPALDDTLVAALRAAYDREVAESGLPATAEDLVLAVLLDRRESFGAPQAPLRELCAAAGLEQRGDSVAHDATVWAADVQTRRMFRIVEAVEDPELGEVLLACLEQLESADTPDAELRGALSRLADDELLGVAADELFPEDLHDLVLLEGAADAADAAIATEALAPYRALGERMCEVARRDDEIAVAHYLAARLAERLGEVIVAEAHLVRASTTSVELGEVIERTGWYAFDRGDARAAVNAWSLLDPAPEAIAIARRFAVDRSRLVGRNDPCWCGSGRKFKVCHQRSEDRAPLPERAVWLHAKGIEFFQRFGGEADEDLFDLATARAVDPNAIESLRAAVTDPILVDAALAEGGWFHRYLDERGVLLPADERELAATWVRVVRSVHEVVAARPGSTLTLRDLVTGEVVEVTDAERSRAPVGQLLCARVLPDGVGHRILGGAFAVAPEHEAVVLALCAEADPVALCEWARDAEAEG